MRRYIGTCPICKNERPLNTKYGNVCNSCRYQSLAKPPGAWTEDAACLNVDPEIFWPDPGGYDTTPVAQEICLGCPVADKCLTYAIETNQSHGIWGGLTPAGRLAYRKRLEEAS